MKKMNFYFALLIGAIMSFSACSSDDEMTEEEKEAQQTQELLETITTNFNNITSKKWTLKQFEPSASMLEASKTWICGIDYYYKSCTSFRFQYGFVVYCTRRLV